MRSKQTLTLADARKIAAAAEAEAQRNAWAVTIAVVDDGGHLLYLQRADGTQFGSVEVAIAKAHTAIAYKRPTKAWEERLANGRLGCLALPDAIPMEGGLPLETGGEIVGAIGVSGVTSIQDGQIAKAGADALAG
ncbi:MAG: heme-binding protein [Pseudomonadota bacterium]